MARDRIRAKGRNSKRRVYALHHDVARHPAWVSLSPYAKLLWLEFGLEYNTVNNGWLACSYKYLLSDRGFKSRSTISKSLNELLWYGFLEQTYPGDIKECARYALTHLNINASSDGRIKARQAPHSYLTHNGEKIPVKIKAPSPPLDIESPPTGPKKPYFVSSKANIGPATGLEENTTKSAESLEAQGIARNLACPT